MTDSFGREIKYLRLSVTELCNLRCRYCMPENGVCKKRHDEMLTEEEMIRAVEAAAAVGIRKVRITGGEPLIKKNILSICERTAAVEGIEEVCVTTNGILLPELAGSLKQAGVTRINLSLDTLNEERYRYITRFGTLEQGLNGLYAALDTGFKQIKINTVLIGGFNEDDIIPIAELTKQYPVDVRFIELMPFQSENTFTSESFLPCSRVLEYLPDLVSRNEFNGTAQLYQLPGAQGSIGLINTLSQQFCAACDRIRLTADGKLKPCLHNPAEYSIKGLDCPEMIAQFRIAICDKPLCRGTLSCSDPSPAGRTMNQIGG